MVVLAALLLGCVHRPRSDRPPVWRLVDAPAEVVGCAEVDVWIVKSGREGVGITLSLRALSTPCSITLHQAQIAVAGGTDHPVTRLPGGTIELAHVPLHIYLPFQFDNLQEWRRGARQGTFVLTLTFPPAARLPDTTAARTIIVRRSMDHWPRETWQADTDALYGLHRKATCALLGWQGGDGGGESFRAVMTVETREPSCAATIDAAFLLTEPKAEAIAAAGLPQSFTLTRGRTAYLVLDFRLPPNLAPVRRLLRLTLRDAGGARFSVEWSLSLPSPFRLMQGRSMP